MRRQQIGRQFGAGCESLEPRRLLAFDPSPFAQELLDSINRMREDPQAELGVLFSATTPFLVARDPQVQSAIDFFNVDRSLLLDQWSELTPTSPIAWSEALTEVAAGHNIAMRDNDVQEHEIDGEPSLGTRVTNAGYSFSSVLENIFAYGESPTHTHAGFVIDWGEGPGGIQDPAGHRDNIMDPRIFDVGIAVLGENNPATEVGPYLITQDFGIPTRRGNPYVLGTAYTDLNRDGVFNAGEGLSGATIIVTGSAGTFTTTTMSAGGYQLRVPAGTYQVIASGGELGGTYSSGTVAVGTNNVKFDFETTTANQRPIARADSATVAENSSVLIHVLGNDTDNDGSLNASTLAVKAQPTSGSVSVSSGRLLYTPDANFSGTDSFTYTVRDNRGAATNAGRVTVEVIPADDGPLASNDLFTVNGGGSGSVNVIANDAYPGGTLIGAIVEITVNGQYGNATVNGTVVSYVPGNGYVGRDTFAYRIIAANGATSNEATVATYVTHPDRPWQNPANPVDVLPDEIVGPLDALEVINKFGIDLSELPDGAPPFLDADGNNAIGPVDALLVINALESTSGASGGGNAVAATGNARTNSASDAVGAAAFRVRLFAPPRAADAEEVRPRTADLIDQLFAAADSESTSAGVVERIFAVPR